MPRSRLLAVLPAVLLLGCAAQRVTFKPSPNERKLLDEPPLPYAVSVVHWSPTRRQNARAYARNLTKLLQGSGAFKSVTYDSTRTVLADLYVESRGEYCNTAIIPLFTIVTLGIYPTIWTEKDCTGMVFRRAGAQAGSDSVVIRVAYEGRYLMGWAALPLGLLPGWSFGQKPYHQKTRLAIDANREALAKLARP